MCPFRGLSKGAKKIPTKVGWERNHLPYPPKPGLLRCFEPGTLLSPLGPGINPFPFWGGNFQRIRRFCLGTPIKLVEGVGPKDGRKEFPKKWVILVKYNFLEVKLKIVKANNIQS